MRAIFKVLIVVLAIIVPVRCLAQIGPQLKLEGFTLIQNDTKRFIDTVSNDSISDISISVRNIGDEPLIISQVHGSDPCYAFSKPFLPINPGERGFIIIRCPTRPNFRVSTSFMIYSNGNLESDSRFGVTRWFKDE